MSADSDNAKLGGWHLVMCGLNHKTSTLDERESLQIGSDDIASAHAALASLESVEEAVILSTCNRNEFYMVAGRTRDPLDLVTLFYRQHRDIDIEPLRDRFYVRMGKHAAKHLFKVAAGIDSMVLGENQILGQVKDAYSSACTVKVAGRIMHRLFHQAFRVGKQVRTETEMGKGSCSVSTAALGLLKKDLTAEDRPTVLFVGAGQMISLAASGWSRLHHRKLMFANRTAAASEELAAKYSASAHGLDELPSLLSEADIVMTCTGSPEPIITADSLHIRQTSGSRHRITILDMAMPRDVDLDGSSLSDVTLYDLDDVEKYVAGQQAHRKAAVPDAERLVEQRLSEFAYWYDHVRHELTGERLVQEFEKTRVDDLTPMLEKLPPQLRSEIDIKTQRLVRKLARIRIGSKGERAEKKK